MYDNIYITNQAYFEVLGLTTHSLLFKKNKMLVYD